MVTQFYSWRRMHNQYLSSRFGIRREISWANTFLIFFETAVRLQLLPVHYLGQELMLGRAHCRWCILHVSFVTVFQELFVLFKVLLDASGQWREGLWIREHLNLVTNQCQFFTLRWAYDDFYSTLIVHIFIFPGFPKRLRWNHPCISKVADKKTKGCIVLVSP